MIEDGIVSLWIGHAASRKAFDKALEVRFSEDGDFLGSPFSRAFKIGSYDEGVKEAEYREEPAESLEKLLEGVSYSDLVIPRLLSAVSEKITANCFVLLYNYRHIGPQNWDIDGLSLRYVGAVRYGIGGHA